MVNAPLNSGNIQIVECPRDAMQGWKHFIPTEQKIRYINSLLRVGFHTIDFGSFVSPKAIPQMADTKEVLAGLDLQNTSSRLLAIIANVRGAEEALNFSSIDYLGFPFSVSETFQQRNTGGGISEALTRVRTINELCVQHGKKLVVYLSMAFGNPYQDAWSEKMVYDHARQLEDAGITILSLADTVGVATPAGVAQLSSYLVQAMPAINWGVHLHATSEGWREKLAAAHEAGCTRFDGALKGIGGCPMANDDLVGNMDTEWILSYFEEKKIELNIDQDAFNKSLLLANEIFV